MVQMVSPVSQAGKFQEPYLEDRPLRAATSDDASSGTVGSTLQAAATATPDARPVPPADGLPGGLQKRNELPPGLKKKDELPPGLQAQVDALPKELKEEAMRKFHGALQSGQSVEDAIAELREFMQYDVALNSYHSAAVPSIHWPMYQNPENWAYLIDGDYDWTLDHMVIDPGLAAMSEWLLMSTTLDALATMDGAAPEDDEAKQQAAAKHR